MIRRPKGFTLIELVMAMVIISVSLTGTIIAFRTASKSSADPLLIQQSMAIAKSYLEEIVQKDFPTTIPCGTPPADGRSVYANVCDYDGHTDVGARDQNDAAITPLAAYTISVSIDTTTASLGSLTSGTEVVRIDVTVSHSEIPGVTISAYRANY